MVRCKTIATAIIVVGLLFFGIPIRVAPPKPSVSTNRTEILFNSYIEKFNKTYLENDTLKDQKVSAFKNSFEEIERLNSIRNHSTSARFGLTKYSDMTKEEFLDKYLQDELYERMKNRTKYIKKPALKHKFKLKNTSQKISITDSLPMKIDWRKKGIMSKIKDQKNCGACWAFSAVETIESMVALQKNTTPPELSVQQLIDCAGYDNNGCDGGDICTLLFWLDDNSVNIQTEAQYPLKWKSDVCRRNLSGKGVNIADFTCNDFVDNEDKILYMLAHHGPVAVAVNALLWQNYLGGVIHYHCDGEPILMNHAVQIVGYDRTAEIPHYIVRNSWGKDFGENGYMYISIGGNTCGLANEVVSLDVK